MSHVIKFQSPFERIKSYDHSPEVSLCKAIITQAIIDATNLSEKKEAKKNENAARAWICNGEEYFQQICFGAEMEPSFVKTLTRKIRELHKSQTLKKQQLLEQSLKQNNLK